MTDKENSANKDLRIQGNEQFNQGNFDAAIGLYTRSLQEEGNSTLTYSNRAFAYLKTGR